MFVTSLKIDPNNNLPSCGFIFSYGFIRTHKVNNFAHWYEQIQNVHRRTTVAYAYICVWIKTRVAPCLYKCLTIVQWSVLHVIKMIMIVFFILFFIFLFFILSHQYGIWSSPPHLIMVCVLIPFGFFIDYVIKRKWLSTTVARKLAETLGKTVDYI